MIPDDGRERSHKQRLSSSPQVYGFHEKFQVWRELEGIVMAHLPGGKREDFPAEEMDLLCELRQ